MDADDIRRINQLLDQIAQQVPWGPDPSGDSERIAAAARNIVRDIKEIREIVNGYTTD